MSYDVREKLEKYVSLPLGGFKVFKAGIYIYGTTKEELQFIWQSLIIGYWITIFFPTIAGQTSWKKKPQNPKAYWKKKIDEGLGI